MKVESLYHTGMVVSDLEAAVEFYTGTLGLALERGIAELKGEFLEQVVGLDGVVLRMAYVGSGTGHSIELMEYSQPPGSKDFNAKPINSVGSAHVGMIVENVMGWYEKLDGMGLNVKGPPVLRDAEYPWARYAFYFQDPDGNWLEFVERGPKPAGSTEN
ncbi:MAG: VOC family protein [Chloroflexi bacterium]|nr:VOC family protein [Chloroflexota bacterium]